MNPVRNLIDKITKKSLSGDSDSLSFMTREKSLMETSNGVNLPSLEKNDFFHSKYFYFGAVILTIGGGALFLLWPELSNKVLFFRHAGLYNYMFFTVMKYFVYGLHMLPNWWPAYSSGYPISLTLNGFLNPIFIITLKFLPPFLANNLIIFIFVIINGLSFYALARALKLSRTGSLISAIAYTFSGSAISWLTVTTFTAILPFLPLSFLCCLKIISGRRKWFWIWLPLLVYAWFSGFTELMIYSLLAASAFAIYLIIKENRKGNSVYLGAILFFGAVILSIILLSPWFLSVSHFVSLSTRSTSMAMSDATSYPISFSQIIHIIYPRLKVFYGEHIPVVPLTVGEDYLLYIGTLPLLLFLSTLFIKQKRTKENLIFFLCLTLAMILLTIKNSPFYWLFHHLPILNKFRSLWKLPFITVFAAAIMAGYGFDNIKDFFQHRFRKYIIKGLWILLCIATLVLGMITVFDQKIKSAMISYGINHYQDTPDRNFTRTNEYYQHLISRMAESVVDNFSLKNKWVIFTVGLWLLALLWITLGHKKLLTARTYQISAIAVTWLGSVFMWVGFMNGPPVSYLTQKPQTAEFLNSREAYSNDQLPLDGAKSKKMKPYRIFLYTPDQFIAVVSEKYKADLMDTEVRSWFTYEMMDYNVNIAFNFDFFFSHEPMVFARLPALMTQITYNEPQSPKISTLNEKNIDESLKYFFTEKNFKLLGMSNVKYIFSPLTAPSADNQFKPIFTAYTKDGIPVNIYENPYFLPRWYFADEIRWTDLSDGKEMKDLKNINDFKKITLLEKKTVNDPAIITKSDPQDKFELRLYTAGKLIINTKTKNYRFFVFSEIGKPFWQVKVNNNIEPLYTANYLYQAVLVPPGENMIEFRYPNLWEQGLISAQSYFQSFMNQLMPQKI